MSLSEAVAAPRFSAASDKIDVCNRIPHATERALAAEGYEVVRSFKSFDFAEVHAVGRTSRGWVGGADPAADGMALAV